MKSCVKLMVAFLLGVAINSYADEPTKLYDENVYTDFKSHEGIKRLERAKFKKAFFYLAGNFESQEVTPFGGPATAAVVMNTLRRPDSKIERPIDETRLTKEELSFIEKDYHPFFKRFTQKNVFVAGVKDKAIVLGTHNKEGKTDIGFQLRQLNDLFLAHKFKSEIHVADHSWSLKALRPEFKKYLNDPSHIIVVNYRRSDMGQPQKNGHLSPLGAYDEMSDSFLVMDVNSNISHWGWVKANALLKAMQTPDTNENRGYLIVSEGKTD